MAEDDLSYKNVQRILSDANARSAIPRARKNWNEEDAAKAAEDKLSAGGYLKGRLDEETRRRNVDEQRGLSAKDVVNGYKKGGLVKAKAKIKKAAKPAAKKGKK